MTFIDLGLIAGVVVIIVAAYHFLTQKKAETVTPAAPVPVNTSHLAVASQQIVQQIKDAVHTTESLAQVQVKQVEHTAKLDEAIGHLKAQNARWDKEDAAKHEPTKV
jgi:hypothetical protein